MSNDGGATVQTLGFGTRTELLERAAENPGFRRNFAGRRRREEVAAAVGCLASEAGRLVAGHTLPVDGGFTIV